MATPPARASIVPAGALLPSSFKVLFGQFYDYVFALLGTDGTPAKAREALNVPLPNYLDNPDGAVYQRAAVGTADDTYMDDRWYALTQTGSVAPSQLNNPEAGYRHGLRITQSQAVAQRMGRAQIVPGERTSELRGKTITVGGRVRFSATANVRLALIAWTGAEDAVVSDVVNNWLSATFTPGNFFVLAGMTLIGSTSTVMTANVPASLSVTGTVPAGATNLIAFYWTEAAAAQNAMLDAWGMRIVEAGALVDYIRLPIAQQIANCQRFCEVYNGAVMSLSKLRESDRSRNANFQFKATKRAIPTITLGVYSLDGGGAITALAGLDGVRFSNLATTDAQAATITSFTAECDL